jgi:hypothetical protein
MRERLDFIGMLTQIGGVCRQVGEVHQGHAALDAPLEGGGLVGVKIHAALFAEQVEDAGKAGLRCRFLKGRCRRLDLRQGRLRSYLREGAGDLLAGQDVIDTASGDSALWHLWERRGGGVLREGDPACSLNRLQARHAV